MAWSYQQFPDPNFPWDQTMLLLQHQSVPEHRLEKITLSKAKNGTNPKRQKKGMKYILHHFFDLTPT